MNKDEEFMQIALKEALKAYKKGEVPVGAVLVQDGKIVAKAHNLVEKRQDATAHAELVCIQKASKNKKNFRLTDCTLYTTLEPCLMCAGAIVLSRVKKIVYAAFDLRHGAIVSTYQVFENRHPIHTPEFKQGPYQDQAAEIMRKFFKQQREKKKNEL